MPEIIAFSRYFPESHRKAGQATRFLEKILKSLPDRLEIISDLSLAGILNDTAFRLEEPKYHTIRTGTRFKAGDKFSPRLWLGDPNTSQQLVFAPEIEIKQTWSFDCDKKGVISINGSNIGEDIKAALAKNDGISMEDFYDWLILPCVTGGKGFKGQIICWSDSVSYPRSSM